MNATKENDESLSENDDLLNNNVPVKPIRNSVLFTIDDNVSDTKTLRFSVNANNIRKQNTEFVKSEDTLPDIRNYRNLLSIGGSARPRPTLFELQNIDTYSVQFSDTRNDTNENLQNINKDVVDSSFNYNNRNRDKNTNKPRKDSRLSISQQHIVKFGWIQGVLVRCILNIFGVMIFLRLSWVVGHAGTGLATFIILIATVVTFITALSASAICTNGEVKGGGAYYLISRSLGPEFGGAIGIVFSFANAVAADMYAVGFAETVAELMKRHGVKIIDNSTNDIRIIGLATIIILLAIALIGMTWESKVQIGLLVILIMSFLNFLVGSFLPPSDEKKSKGFLGYKFSIFVENIMPDFQGTQDFAHVFGVFFPAVTGILAGANISGNLRSPQNAIPKGTILSIFITSFIYILFAWICGATVVRQASGDLADLTNETFPNCKDKKCAYGLMNNYQTMEMVSAYGPIITAGIFSASLSSALASLISAPKIFQAVCADRIFPKLEFFSVGYGKSKEPWRAYFLTFFIATACIAIGDLNLIAPIISNFFLMSYALINYSCFDASIAKTPGWRPAFKYYNKWISLFGALLCICVMFVIKWWAALVTFLVIAGIYLYVRQAKPDINWGSSTQAHIYRRSLEYSLKLMSIEEHVKNFRPQCLVLTGMPMNRPALCDLVAAITKNTSLMVYGNVTVNKEIFELNTSPMKIYKWFRKRGVKGFYTEVNANSIRDGSLAMMQCIGIGKLKPNTLVIGFKSDWKDMATVESTMEYFQMINDAFCLQYGICILRVPGGLYYQNLFNDELNDETFSLESDDYDGYSNEIESNIFTAMNLNKKTSNNASSNKTTEYKSEIDYSSQNGDEENQIEANKTATLASTATVTEATTSGAKSRFNNFKKKLFPLNKRTESDSRLKTIKNYSFISMKNYKLPEIKSGRSLYGGNGDGACLEMANVFYHKYKKSFIDVWWLYDDGGLTILIPYLLSQRKHWQQSKLRVFIQTKKPTNDSAHEARSMAALLTKFRIKFDDVIVLSTFNLKPSAKNCELYEKSIEKWRLKSDESQEQFPWKISDTLIKQNQERINHYIRLRELLLEYSMESALIVITITVPSKISTSAGLYLSWLDFISDGMPPVLMIRGNQTPVLTYYS